MAFLRLCGPQETLHRRASSLWLSVPLSEETPMGVVPDVVPLCSLLLLGNSSSLLHILFYSGCLLTFARLEGDGGP